MQAVEQETSEVRDELQSMQGEGQCMRHGLQKDINLFTPILLVSTLCGHLRIDNALCLFAHLTSICKRLHPKHHLLWQHMDILDSASCNCVHSFIKGNDPRSSKTCLLSQRETQVPCP